MNKSILSLPPNRIRRNYHGGAGLDRIEGADTVTDCGFPEDWIASTVPARNPGLPVIENEGLSFIIDAGHKVLLTDLFKQDPVYYLGQFHVKEYGTSTGFLTKLLDSSMRLHVQAHPTKEFAAQHLNSQWGKLEAYFILDVRKDIQPYIRLGFQHPPEPSEWRRIVCEQDIAAMDRCFDKIPVQPGEVWYVPGGLPHAIGEGLTVIEVMEPTDLVVRCEFEREGIVVPPQARFMGRDPDFALKVFDFTEYSCDTIRNTFRVTPQTLRQTGTYREDLLIGRGQTDCFEIRKLTVKGNYSISKDSRFTVAIVTSGTGTVRNGTEIIPLQRGSRFFVAAAEKEISLSVDSVPLEVICCYPSY